MQTERHKVIINVQNNQDWWFKFKNKWAGHGLALLKVSPLWYGVYMLIAAGFVIGSLLKGDFDQAIHFLLVFLMSFALWSGTYAYRHCSFEYQGEDE